MVDPPVNPVQHLLYLRTSLTVVHILLLPMQHDSWTSKVLLETNVLMSQLTLFAYLVHLTIALVNSCTWLLLMTNIDSPHIST
jgi:hypothetical protein